MVQLISKNINNLIISALLPTWNCPFLHNPTLFSVSGNEFHRIYMARTSPRTKQSPAAAPPPPATSQSGTGKTKQRARRTSAHYPMAKIIYGFLSFHFHANNNGRCSGAAYAHPRIDPHWPPDAQRRDVNSP